MASSPPSKGSKRQQLREAARHGYGRFRQMILPDSRPSSPHSESLAAPPAGATFSLSAISNTPSRSTAQLILHNKPVGDTTASSAQSPLPSASPTLAATRTSELRPGPTTVDKIKEAGSVAWAGLETALRVLEKSADVFPPLRSVVGGFIDCLDIIQEAATSRDDYKDIATELTTLTNLINQYAAELGSEDAGSSASRIVLSIEAEIAHIRKQQDRDTGRRIIESTQDKEDVIKRYHRIEALFRQLQSDVSLRAWKTTDKQFKTSLLRDLSPVDDALYNSSYSTTIKRRGCTAETREKVQADLQDWVQDPDGAKVYWMNGMAGTGKTTIAYSLCEWLWTNRQLGAGFFCSRASSSCRNANQIIPTIAYQLAQYSPAFRSTLCKALEENPNAGKLNVVWQFKQLMQAPLQQVKGAMPGGVVVVIDALDECEDAYAVRLILETLLKLAADLPIKFFVTSRPEPAISDKMLSPGGHLPTVLHLHDIEESIVEGDIKKYLTESLSSMSTPPSPSEIEVLAKRAGKLFIYAATTVRYILPEGTRVNSSARLRAMLRTAPHITPTNASNMRYKELDALYTSILVAAFDSGQLEPEERDVMQLALRTVVCAKEPLTATTLASLLRLSEEEVSSALQPLRSVLHVSEAGGHVSTLHASFPDFLFDRARSTVFFCDTAQQNELLAHRCFDIMKEQLRFNICNLGSSCVFDKDVPDLEERIRTCISPALFYACRYWGGHLQLAGTSAKLCSYLLDLLTQRLLSWIEVLNLKQCVVAGSDILVQAQDWLSAHDVVAGTKEQAADAQAFVTRFAASACKRSTPHIYISALPFCPRSSSVYENYWRRTRGVIEMKGTAMGERDNAALATWLTDSKIRTTAFSPDGTRIASGSDDGGVRVWDARTSDLIVGPLEGHTGIVNSVTFSPDGSRIASSSHDCTIRLWNARTGDIVAGPFEGHTDTVWSVAFSPDGSRIASGSDDNTIRMWDARAGDSLIEPLEGHTDAVWSVAFSPDGTLIVSGSLDCTIRVWDSHTGDIVAPPFEGHSGKVWSVAFSPDSTRIVSGSDDLTVRVWDVRTSRVVAGPFEGHTMAVYSVAFSPDGTRIASGSRDYTVRVWDICSGSNLCGLFQGHTEVVESVAFSPDGTRIVSGSLDHTIRVWDARPGHTVSGAFQGHSNSVMSISFSPDGASIVSGSYDRTIRVWDARTGNPIMKSQELHTEGVYSVAFSPDGCRIASGSDDHTIRVWGAHNGDTVAGPFKGHSGEVSSVAFSPDGTRIVSGAADHTVRVWDSHTGETVVGPLEGHTDWVESVAISSDGSLIVSGSFDHTIRTWDARSGDATAGPFEGHTDEVRSVEFSPDGNLIVSGSSDHTIRVWNVRTGAANAEPFKGHTSRVTSVAFSPDGSLIVSGSHDRTVRLWNAHTGDLIAEPFQGHADKVYSVAFSPDGGRIVSGSGDYAIRVWDIGDLARQNGGLANSVQSDAPSRTCAQAASRLDDNLNRSHLDAPKLDKLTSAKQARIYDAFAGTADFTPHNDGWITGDDVPLVWFPPDFRAHLPFPHNTLVIGSQGGAYVDYGNLLIGEQWVECYIPE